MLNGNDRQVPGELKRVSLWWTPNGLQAVGLDAGTTTLDVTAPDTGAVFQQLPAWARAATRDVIVGLVSFVSQLDAADTGTSDTVAIEHARATPARVDTVGALIEVLRALPASASVRTADDRAVVIMTDATGAQVVVTDDADEADGTAGLGSASDGHQL